MLSSRSVILGEPALTLRLLSEKIYQCSPVQRHQLSRAGRCLLLQKVVEEASSSGHLPHLSQLSALPGFTASLASLLDELKLSLVTPESFFRFSQTSVSPHIPELALLFARYQEQLQKLELFDSNDPHTMALAHLCRHGQLPDELVAASSLRVNDLYDFTPLQLALLLQLARHHPLLFRIPFDPDDPEPYAAALRTIEQLEKTDNGESHLEPPEFIPLAGIFVSLLASPAPPRLPGPCRIVEAPTTAEETAWVGRSIRELMEAGELPGTIAVLFRDTARYGSRLEEVCTRYRIPISSRRGAPLLTSPLVHACLAPLMAAQRNLDRHSLVELCTSTYLYRPPGSPPADQVARLLQDAGYLDESLCTAEKAVGRLIAGRRATGRCVESEESCLAALAPLLKEARRWSLPRSMNDFLALMLHSIERFRIYHQGIGGGDRHTVRRDASAILLFQQNLQELSSDLVRLGMADRVIPPGAFLGLIRQALEGAFLAGERQDGVSLLSFHDCRGLSFRHVFIVGLNDGICPARHDQHPLLPDDARQRFNRLAGEGLLRTAGDRRQEEPLLFRYAVSCATSSITLSLSLSDGTGTSFLPSQYLEQLCTHADITVFRPSRLPSPSLASCCEPLELLSALLRHPDVEAPRLTGDRQHVAAMVAREQLHSDLSLQLSTAATPSRPTLSRPDIVAELSNHFGTEPGNIFSPTALEEYARCPFRFFIRRILQITPPQEISLEPSTAERGTLIHELLRSFFSEAGARGLLPLSGCRAEGELLQEVATQVFSRWEGQHPLPPPLWQTHRSQALSRLRTVVDKESRDNSGPVPVAWEHSFPPLALTAPDGSSFQLAGTVDRIDRSTAGDLVRVVDYKLSGDKGRYSRLLKEEEMGVRSFQMPVYAASAAREAEEMTGRRCTALEVRYWLVKGGEWASAELGAGPGGFLTPEIPALPPDDNGPFFWRVWQVISRMKSGIFPPTPNECSFCEFGGVCRTGD